MNEANTPTSPQHTVDPPYLVVTTKTALPKRCIVTNNVVSDSEYQIWHLPSIPRWLWWFTFFSPGLLIAYPFCPWKCRLAAGLSKRVRRKLLLKKTCLMLMILSPLFFTIAAAATGSMQYLSWAVGCAVLPYFGLPWLVLLTPPLQVHRQKRDLFWIRGCSKEFLASLTASTDNDARIAGNES